MSNQSDTERNVAFVRERITQLRLEKGVSEYKMSYDLGHSRGYIYNISSGKTLPSMTEFLYICEYFGITPQEFFNTDAASPQKAREITREVERLSPEQAEHILRVVRDLVNDR